MTVEEAAALLGISPRSAYRAAASGEIPTIRIGRRILVPTALIHRMLGINETHGSEANTPTQGGSAERSQSRYGRLHNRLRQGARDQ